MPLPEYPSPFPRPSPRSLSTLMEVDGEREAALREYRSVLLKHTEADAKVKRLRTENAAKEKEYDKTEDDLLSLQSVGQIIAEVLRQLDDERCTLNIYDTYCSI